MGLYCWFGGWFVCPVGWVFCYGFYCEWFGYCVWVYCFNGGGVVCLGGE